MGGERDPGRHRVDHDLNQNGHRRTGPAPAVVVSGQIFRDSGGPYREPVPVHARRGIGQPRPQLRVVAHISGHHEAGRYREPRPGQLRQYRRLATHARPAQTRSLAQVNDPAHDRPHR
jgi:hypothetical protein